MKGVWTEKKRGRRNDLWDIPRLKVWGEEGKPSKENRKEQ